MKVGAALAVLGLGMGVFGFAATQGCGSDDGDGGSGAQQGKVPPSEEGDPAPAGAERTFALNQIWLGETTRAGAANKDAWKSYGFNLDGRITNVTDQNSPDLGKVCKRVQNAKATIHQDGDEGIDNAFGKEVLTLLSSAIQNPSRTVSDSILAGNFTIMLKVTGLSDDPQQTNTALGGTVLVGGAFNADPNVRPTFAETESWPFLKEPQVPITGAYINKGVFVNGKGGTEVKLNLALGGQTLNVTINRAIISFRHDPATKSLEEGTIAGVIRTEEFVNAIGQVAGSFGLCEGTTVEGIKSSIRFVSDILVDGADDPARTCDGISIGLGFTAKQIAAPTTEAPPPTPAADPCAG